MSSKGRVLLNLISFLILISVQAHAESTLGWTDETANFEFLNLKKIKQLGSEIIEKLHQASSRNHHVLGYDKARNLLMGHIYLRQNGSNYFLRDVYCQKDFSNSDFSKGNGLGPNKIPDNRVLNVEHTWPQSRFTSNFPREAQKSDLHHLYPTDSEMNSLRSSHKFGEVSRSRFNVKCPASDLGEVDGKLRFEPPQEHKGHVARALFYFSVRYKTRLDADEESILRKWHREHPIDNEEREHHETISQLQGNRNPFIDEPELVDQISDF